MSQIKVTVYITSHNYGRYLKTAVDSVLSQSLATWELFIVDDGSTDDTYQIAQGYGDSDERIFVIRNEIAQGLRNCANAVLNLARGELIIRLDADDYFDDSALLILANYLDNNPTKGLVFPNWIYIDEKGGFLGIENRKRVGSESKVLDLPAHGACTMIRKRVLKSIGGYDPQFDAQDGHELWLKVLHRFDVGNVTTPLFFYRQHGSSMSRDENRILNARQKIKRGISKLHSGKVKPRVVAVVPAKNSYAAKPNIVMEEIAGKPLIDYTLEAAKACELLDEVYVYSDDQAVVDYSKSKFEVFADLRPSELSSSRTKLSSVLSSAVNTLEDEHNVHADIVVLLSVHSPLRKSIHITKAIDTLMLYNVDNVISTFEDIELHFVHGENGMEPINSGMLNKLRLEREALYVDNGAIQAIWREFVQESGLYRGRVGHVVMSRNESFQIKSASDHRLVEMMLVEQEARNEKAAGQEQV